MEEMVYETLQKWLAENFSAIVFTERFRLVELSGSMLYAAVKPHLPRKPQEHDLINFVDQFSSSWVGDISLWLNFYPVYKDITES